MLYCEGTLIAAYVTHELHIPDLKDAHFGAVMVVNFEKSSGVLPTPEKTAMQWAKNRDVWTSISNVFVNYVDAQKDARDAAQTYRKPFLKVLTDLEDELKMQCRLAERDVPITGDSDEGPLRGILRLPPSVDGGGTLTYVKTIQAPLSLAEIRTNIEQNRAYNIVGQEVDDFSEDIKRVFSNAIRWHSKGRWIPDTDDNRLDPNDCTEQEMDQVQFKPRVFLLFSFLFCAFAWL